MKVSKKKSSWLERDEFWRDVAPILFHRARLANTPVEVRAIIRRLGLRRGQRVLDLCCGIGRHSLELARQGFRVTGVDRTRAYLEAARRRAKKEGLKVEFVQQDMRQYVNPGVFDAAINMFTSFGFFRDQADDLRVLKNLHCSLRPNGRLLMDMAGKEILARVFHERDWRELDGWLVLEERRLNPDWSGLENRWIAVKGSRRFDYRFKLRVYSGVELVNALKQTGFRSTAIYGNLQGGPYDHTARRLVALARR